MLMHLTQSAISQQIRELEICCGLRLVEGNGARLRNTNRRRMADYLLSITSDSKSLFVAVTHAEPDGPLSARFGRMCTVR